MEFRFAERSDSALVLSFIQELAEYERMADQVVATAALLEEQLFDNAGAEVVFALIDGTEAGFALFFPTFSTFLGRAGMHLEDLFVKPAYRGRGVGSALLTYLARICDERGYGRMEWQCLDWNEPSIRFYRSLGAETMDDWMDFRLSGTSLAALAAPAEAKTPDSILINRL